jgi:hypothetical protein
LLNTDITLASDVQSEEEGQKGKGWAEKGKGEAKEK